VILVGAVIDGLFNVFFSISGTCDTDKVMSKVAMTMIYYGFGTTRDIEMNQPLTIDWNIGCPTPQRGVTTYSISANRQRPLAGAFHSAIFNTWRRFRQQVLFVAPPFIAAYAIMNWAIERSATWFTVGENFIGGR
jgi:ubiquinol-cytochrome c reductase subunit 8